MRANEFVNELVEARRNNFGREISNVQGQALGKKLASGDPNAQQALAQAKAAQKTNVGDMYGKNMNTLGLTTPQQRLAANKAAAAKYGDMSVDPDEVRTPQAQPQAQAGPVQPQSQAEPTQAQPAPVAPQKTAVDRNQNPIDRALKPVSNAYNAVAQAGNTVAQSKLGQTLGGWSQRLVGVGNKTAAAQQIWTKNYMSMVNNMIANANNSQIKFDFGDAMDKYMLQQKLKLDPTQRQYIKSYADKVQQGGFKRADLLKLGNTLWTTGLTAQKSQYGTQNQPLKKAQNTTKPAPGLDAGDKAIGSMADQLTGATDEKQSSGAFGQMAKQLGTTTQPASSDTGSTYGQGTQAAAPAAPAAAPAAPQKQQKTVPVGTKFAVPTKSGDKFIAQKTDTGWKVGGSMITDPKQVEKLELQATQATPQKGARAAGSVKRGVRPVRTPASATQAKPTRQLKAPSALAKGAPGKPAKVGKSRIR